MKSDIWAPPYSQNGMIITQREYSTVRLGVESGSSYRSIKSSIIRGHPCHLHVTPRVINCSIKSEESKRMISWSPTLTFKPDPEIWLADRTKNNGDSITGLLLICRLLIFIFFIFYTVCSTMYKLIFFKFFSPGNYTLGEKLTFKAGFLLVNIYIFFFKYDVSFWFD